MGTGIASATSSNVSGGIPATSGTGPPWSGYRALPEGFVLHSKQAATPTHKPTAIDAGLEQALERAAEQDGEVRTQIAAARENYRIADTSPRAEWDSFCAQLGDAAERRKTILPPSEEEEAAILACLEEMYSDVMVPLPKNWNTREYFESCLEGLDNSSSPGYPYMREASTIGQWLGADGLGNYNSVQIERLWYDVQLVMADQFDHYFRAFVKDEPHKLKKAIEKRWRLVIASALPVQMVWRMLFKHQNDSLNAHPYASPSKHGLVFCYGGWRRFLAFVKTNRLFYSRDISGWDVNAPGWVLLLVGRWRACWPGITEEWIRVKDMMYRDAFQEAKILFSNGWVLKQNFDGFMKSGIYNTISDNSVSMVGMHVGACIRSGQVVGKLAATGDDVLQSVVSDSYLSELEALGCRVKEVLSNIEFMGTNYDRGYPEPLYFQKHLVSFVTKKGIEEEVLDSYLRLYAYSDRFVFWKRVAELVGASTRTSAYYRFWYSSPLARVMSLL